MTHRWRRLLTALVLAAALLPVAATGTDAAVPALADGARPAAAFEPLPECRYQDIKTRFRKPGQWRRTLLDTNLMVGRAYRPSDLVAVGRAGIGGSGQVRAVVIDDLRAMARAARRAGASIAIRSAYRSYATQGAVFAGSVARDGLELALRYSARPGHSEHQLGTTIDFRSAASTAAPWDYADWGQTPPGRWMQRNAWRYGWVMSYPAGRTKLTCYGYEPWHWRYVGRRMAREVRESGLTLRKFLWRRFESAP